MTKIALVGHCGIDGPRLQDHLTTILGDASIASCNDPEALQRACEEGVDLLLFNRELGFGFGDAEGVALIQSLHASHPNIRCMLISDYPDAQQRAQEAGACPGFGKADLGTDKVQQALRGALS